MSKIEKQAETNRSVFPTRAAKFSLSPSYFATPPDVMDRFAVKAF
jgi:hypothetical protein